MRTILNKVCIDTDEILKDCHEYSVGLEEYTTGLYGEIVGLLDDVQCDHVWDLMERMTQEEKIRYLDAEHEHEKELIDNRRKYFRSRIDLVVKLALRDVVKSIEEDKIGNVNELVAEVIKSMLYECKALDLSYYDFTKDVRYISRKAKVDHEQISKRQVKINEHTTNNI